MNTKSVYQLNDEGYLIGVTVAFESPLEPGVYHIPRGCVDTNLPLPELTQQDDVIKWTGSEWVVYNERIEKEKLKLEEIQKIENEKERQEELQKLEKEKHRQELINKKIELNKKLEIINKIEELEKTIKANNELSNLTYGELVQIQTEMAQLKEKLWQH